MKQGIPINNEILIWARERAGYAIEEMIKNFPKLPEWENNTAYPTYSQLELLAQKYKVTIALFFFPTPPKELPIEKSLRAINEKDVHNLKPQVRFLFRKAKAFQIYLKELLIDEQENQRKKLNWLTEGTTKPPGSLAGFVRKTLNVPIEIQLEWKNLDQALDEWRNILADNGIYVFKDAFKDDRISGFCIYDDLFPVIYINNSMSKSRQIFTIFHELAHLIFKESYLDLFNPYYQENELPDIEVICNAFAGNFLVPDNNFKNTCEKFDVINNIESLAQLYKVSKEVILRKALNNELITKKLFSSKIKEWIEQAKRKKEFTKAKSGGNYYLTKFQYLGDSYSLLVFTKYFQGKIDLDKASTYLDVKPKLFSKLEDKFLKKGV